MPPFAGAFFDPVIIGPPAVGFEGEFVPGTAEADEGPDEIVNDSGRASAEAKRDRPVTLLQLTNGWMYGLIDYWVEGDKLHYITNYGGENSIPLDWIDFPDTIRLNSERGIDFTLHSKLDAPTGEGRMQ